MPSCVGPGFGTLFEVPDPVGRCFQGLPDTLVKFFTGLGLGSGGPVWVPGFGLAGLMYFGLALDGFT